MLGSSYIVIKSRSINLILIMSILIGLFVTAVAAQDDFPGCQLEKTRIEEVQIVLTNADFQLSLSQDELEMWERIGDKTLDFAILSEIATDVVLRPCPYCKIVLDILLDLYESPTQVAQRAAERRSQAQATYEFWLNQRTTIMEQMSTAESNWIDCIGDSLGSEVILDDYLSSASSSFYQEEYQAAIDAYTSAIELFPELAILYYYRANVYFAVGDYSNAIDDYSTAIALDPQSIYHYSKANVLVREERYDEAIVEYTSAISLDSSSAILYFARGNTFYLMDSCSQAVSDYGQYVDLAGQNADPVIVQYLEIETCVETLDLIFVIDTTGSMEDDIAEVRANALRILDRVAASGADWRISIVTYRDHPQAPYGDPGDYPSRVELNFSSDYGEITDAINGIRIGGGADFQESVYSGLHTAISQSWRPGVRKVIILMGDAPPHNPEPITGYTHNSVLQAAYDADPVSIYPIQIADDSDTRFAFQSLADGSSGRLFTARTADDVVDTLVYTVTSITEIPQLALELTPGSLAEVMTDPSSILPLRQDPTSASSVLEDLRAGSRVTVLAGPEYADGYLWWNIESATGTRGWSVEAVGGIQTLIPLTDTRPVPFRDHFYDNRAGWEISLTGNAVTSLIRDGLYTIVAAVTDQFEYWIVAPGFENWSLAPIFDEPYEVEFRVLDVQASSGGYGLAILFDVQQGYKPHKRLFLNSDGTWQLFRWTGVRELLGEGVLEGGPINLADRRSHVIKLRVETDQYTVFVDDNQVLQIPSVDPILGTVGFGVAKGPAITGDRITIRFDDLVVRSLVED